MKFNELREESAGWMARMGLFYLSVLAFVAIVVLFVGRFLLFPFTAWFDPGETGAHFVHDVTFMGMLFVAVVAMAAQLYRPAERIVAMQIALVVALFTLATTLVSSGVDPMLAVFLGPVAIAGLLHPARRDLVRFEALADGTANWLLLGLAAVALVPVAAYAASELSLQATLQDDHAELGHYAGMATYGLTMVALVALAAVSGASHRLAVAVAGLMALLLAAASTFQPTVSAIDATWSALAVVWAVVVVAAFEWDVRSATAEPRPETDDPDPTEDLEGGASPR